MADFYKGGDIIINIAVVDDNSVHRKILIDIINKWAKENRQDNTISEFKDGESFLFKTEEVSFDLIFLDIMMPKINGMDLAYILRERKISSIIVFLTAEKSFVFKGYKVNAFDYLLKPIKEEDVFEVLNSVNREINKEKPFILVEGTFGIRKLNLEDILYIEAQNKEILIKYLNDNEILEIKLRSTLDYYVDLIKTMEEGRNFSMPHRSYFCNISKIESVDRNNISYGNGILIPISRNRRDEFINNYLSFMRERRR